MAAALAVALIVGAVGAGPAEACSGEPPPTRVWTPAGSGAASSDVIADVVVRALVLRVLDEPPTNQSEQAVEVEVLEVGRGEGYDREVVRVARGEVTLLNGGVSVIAGMCGGSSPSPTVEVGAVVWFSGVALAKGRLLAAAHPEPVDRAGVVTSAPRPGTRPAATSWWIWAVVIGGSLAVLAGALRFTSRSLRTMPRPTTEAGGVTESEGEPPHG